MAQSQTLQLKGSVTDTEGAPVAYTSVLLVPDGEEYTPANKHHQMTVADTNGDFEFNAAEGLYNLTLSCVGYESRTVEFSLTANTDLGVIVLTQSAEAIETVTITGNLITREADRFVMNNLSESALAKGRDSYEMLRLAPAVYADNSGGVPRGGSSSTTPGACT